MSQIIQQLKQAGLKYWPGFYSTQLADQYLKQLIDEVSWSEDHFYTFGRRIEIPRLQAWYADAGIRYSYSNNLLQQQKWLPLLQQIKLEIEQQVQHQFNSVLLTYYRNGQDSVSWHADDENELGPEPWIASLSLGSSRLFQYRHKQTNQQAELLLNNGDLLLMHPAFQHHWQHQVPEEADVNQPRINLTFRLVTD
jgi:alkylated DNA repair dioxygenase AlkB